MDKHEQLLLSEHKKRLVRMNKQERLMNKLKLTTELLTEIRKELEFLWFVGEQKRLYLEIEKMLKELDDE